VGEGMFSFRGIQNAFGVMEWEALMITNDAVRNRKVRNPKA
jgi:hypothetical protein